MKYQVKLTLLPRQNFNYSLRDMVIALKGSYRPVKNFDKINELFENKNIFFLNHARTGLRLLLNSLGLPQNARIGVQILNCHTVFNAIVKAGYKPVFIDINDDLTMSISDLKKKLDEIDALIVTHLFGMPAAIEEILPMMNGKPVIEDCAHSFLSQRNGQLTGTFGDASIFSIGKGKFPSIGSGGFVVINNSSILPQFEELYLKLPGNNLYGELKNIAESLSLNFLHIGFIYKFVTFPGVKKIYNKLELDRKFEAAEKRIFKTNLSVFLNNYETYESMKEKQVETAGKLRDFLGCDGISEPDSGSLPNNFMLPVITNKKGEIVDQLKKNGIEAGPHFYRSIEWAKELGYTNNNCRNAEKIIPNLIVIPTYKHFKIPSVY